MKLQEKTADKIQLVIEQLQNDSIILEDTFLKSNNFDRCLFERITPHINNHFQDQGLVLRRQMHPFYRTKDRQSTDVLACLSLVAIGGVEDV